MPLAIALGFVLALAAALPDRVDAGSVRITAGGTFRSFPDPAFHGTGPQRGHRFHGGPPRQHRVHEHPSPGHRRPGHVRRPRHQIFVVPGPIVIAPSRCWRPGHYAYYWAPQAVPYHVWVAGHWSPQGTWVEGHYQTHLYPSGSYQPYWVEGHWAAC